MKINSFYTHRLLAAIAIAGLPALLIAEPDTTYSEKPEVAAARYLDARRQSQAVTTATVDALAARGPEVRGHIVEIAGKIVGRTTRASASDSPLSFVLRIAGSEYAVFIDVAGDHALIKIGNTVHVLAEFPADGQPLDHYQMREIVLTADLPLAKRNVLAVAQQETTASPAEAVNTINRDPLAGQPSDSPPVSQESSPPQAEVVARPGTLFPDMEQWATSAAVSTWMEWVKKRNPRLNDLQVRLIVETVLYYSHKFTIDHRLAFAMIKYESDFNPRCLSHAGAMGLTQLMPGTAKYVGVSDPWDIQQNIMGGIKYLAEQLYTYENRSNYEQTILALACYNAGPNAVKRAGGVPNFSETQRYVKRVSDLFLQLYESGMP